MFNLVILSFPFIGWLSYYISAVLYRGLVKKGNSYARLIQVLTALGIFVILMGLILVFIESSVRLER